MSDMLRQVLRGWMTVIISLPRRWASHLGFLLHSTMFISSRLCRDQTWYPPGLLNTYILPKVRQWLLSKKRSPENSLLRACQFWIWTNDENPLSKRSSFAENKDFLKTVVVFEDDKRLLTTGNHVAISEWARPTRNTYGSPADRCFSPSRPDQTGYTSP